MKDTILKFVLQNAVKFGKSEPGRITGKVFGENPDFRNQAKEVSVVIKKTCDEVNAMSPEERLALLQKLAPDLLEKKSTKKEGLKDLPNAKDGAVVTRMAPSPSGPLHIGHSYVTSLNVEYAKKYHGKFYFRIEDTNPSNIYEQAYDLIPEDANWLTENDVAEFIIQSDRLEIYYDYALKLIEAGHVYVCECDSGDFRNLIGEGIECPCRKLEADAQVKRWHKLFDAESGYKQGEAVLRFKTDIKHKNPAMRDFPLMRINDEEHPRVGKKYRVWPLMNLSVAIDDMELGITHALRGKDHADNAKRQKYIHDALGFKTPEAISLGRINFEGIELSTTKTKEKIEAGQFEGWDDIRLPTLLSLRRQGIQPAALRKYAGEVGISKTDKTVAAEEFFKHIHALNKEIIESTSNRYFFIQNPKEIEIEGAPDVEIELDLHPDHKKGGRFFSTRTKFYIQDDIREGQVYRLMNLFNFRREGSKYFFDSKDYDPKKIKNLIHWLPVGDELVNIEIRMSDNSIVKGIGEKWVNEVKEGDIIQFERFGFCRCDEITPDKVVFWFTHK